MSERVCRSCEYSVVSTVVNACPNCGEPLPRTLGSGASGLVVLALLLIGGAGAWTVLRATFGERTPPSPPSVASGAASTAGARPARPATEAKPSAPPDVNRLVAQLEGDDGAAWTAAAELARLDTPRAQEALMAAYRRRDYKKMAGATAFYARRRPPQYATVLLALLRESRDLAVAQDLILSKDPKLAVPAREWAAKQGFQLVPSKETPTGVTWTGVR